MKDISNRNFGLLIAYIIPGLVVLWGLSYVSPTARFWLSTVESGQEVPAVGGFLYGTLASLGLGMIASVIRWAVIDSINHVTGLSRPVWDDGKLQDNLAAYQVLVEIHYHYYQFYANTLISLAGAYGVRRNMIPGSYYEDAAIVTLGIILWMAQRDALGKYYQRANRLLGNSQQGDDAMTNGGHHSTGKPPKPAQTHNPARPDLDKSKEKDADAAEGKKKKDTPAG